MAAAPARRRSARHGRAPPKTFQGLLDYNVDLGRHHIGALLGYTWEDENQRTIGGYRNNYPSDDVPYLSAGGVDGQTNSGGGYGGPCSR